MNYLVSKRIPNAEAFLEHCERITMKSKSVVFRQGELSQDFYVILEGSVSVIVDDVEDSEQEMVVSTSILANSLVKWVCLGKKPVPPTW
jgi:CRP/FNR family cyclic AMP-dependent transcriptional regulator